MKYHKLLIIEGIIIIIAKQSENWQHFFAGTTFW